MLAKLTRVGTTAGFTVTLLEPIKFTDLVQGVLGTGGLEGHLEELIRTDLRLLFGSEATALVVGQQVLDENNKRSDLVALDSTGSLVLIELKRAAKDMRHRAEPLELQAIRYAATLATIRTVEDLVRDMFEAYVGRHRSELDRQGLAQLTDGELASRLILEFLDQNGVSGEGFNKHQAIYLVATTFTDEVLSASAWLASEGVDIHCVVARPLLIDGTYVLDFDEIIPPKSLSDYYVGVRASSAPSRVRTEGRRRTGESGYTRRTSASGISSVRWREMIEQGILNLEDRLILDSTEGEMFATLITSDGRVRYDSHEMSAQEWGKKVKHWSTINIYDHAFVAREGVRIPLSELRREAAERINQRDAETSLAANETTSEVP